MGDYERFPRELDMRKMNGKQWKLLTPFVFDSTRLNMITVPAGFVTDLASVPALARWYVSRDGDHTKPAIIHDYLYTRASEADFPNISRLDADRVFREAMIIRGVNRIRANILYQSVRLGGGSSFRNGTG